MGEILMPNIPDLSNIAAWTIHNALNPPPPTIDIRTTTIETDDGISVLMRISIDDEQE